MLELGGIIILGILAQWFAWKLKNAIPIFLKDNTGNLTIISSYNKDIEKIEKVFYLVYLGKPIE